MCSLDGCGTYADLPPIVVPDEKRRLFLQGLVGLPIAAVLADPTLARAAAAGVEMVTIPTAGGRAVTLAVALPAAGKGPAVVLIHEWWGLNDQIKSVAAELAAQGYVAIAVDLYGKPAATTPEAATALMKAVDPAVATDQLVSTIAWARAHARSTGKVGTIGWCFGGGWSLNASLATPVDATVIYYGDVKKTADQVKSLSGPVLGQFGKLDAWINAEMVGGFEAAMKAAGKADRLTVHWYDADHAFANPTGARYDAAPAALAWQRTLAFFKTNLG
ncbi:dienelactone hydrolase family protein [Siculibacillus lacustris]|uniref:Dienelactone hydrolase family protein n=1 Tax=Siculibacillus lacustris TaxID=1549641 RepID=A0A4Q9VUX4_9HYPH|nr:dienelactone hydrolase family protein [Siculibacillus lacustris]TBW39553.1 dienelactone hydrolase family protein [Siculibacillus lacustris]